jgi:phosphohistidine swiveling domain-containing protein
LPEVYSVLSGEQKFTGDSGVGLDLEPDPDSEGYIEDLHFQQAGKVRITVEGCPGWYRPTAYLVMDHPCIYRSYIARRSGDIGEVYSKEGCYNPTMVHSWCQFATTYAVKGEIVESVAIGSYNPELIGDNPDCKTDEPVLLERSFNGLSIMFWESCDAPPPWVIEQQGIRRNREEAVREYVEAGHTVDERRVVPLTAWEEDILQGFRMSKAQNVFKKTRPLQEPKGPSDTEIEAVRQKIVQQADVGVGWMTLKHGDKKLRVPKAPFINWALHRTPQANQAPDWDYVSPSDWKQTNDDRYHTDWVVGAGIPLDDWMDDSLRSSAENEMFKLQEQARGPIEPEVVEERAFRTGILSPGGNVRGRAVHLRRGDKAPGAILILPNLHPDYLEAALEAQAIITEVGGRMAHLVTVLRPQGMPILFLTNARKKVPDGSVVRVNPSTGWVELE